MGCLAFFTNIMANQSKIPEKVNVHEILAHFLKRMIKKIIPIIEKIKKEHIKPTSRLIFMFKKSLMWFLLIIWSLLKVLPLKLTT